MATSQEPVRIGRVNRGTERALGISLTGETNIYMKADDLDRFAAKKPDSYLKLLEEIASIIKTPDFVSFDAEEEAITYIKHYFHGGMFHGVYIRIRHKGRPAKWIFEKLVTGDKTTIPPMFGSSAFVRPQYKRIPEGDKGV